MSVQCGRPTKKGNPCSHQVAYPGAPCAARRFHQDPSAGDLMAMAIQQPPFPETGDIHDRQMIGQILPGSMIHDADIDNVDFTLAVLDESVIVDTKMRDTIAVGASFKDAILNGLTVRDTDFAQSTWALAQVQKIQAVHSSWKKAILRGATFQGSFTYCTFMGASFVAADLTGCRFYKCVFKDIVYDGRTVWPAGFVPPASASTPAVSSV